MKVKSVTVSIVSPSIFHEVMGPNAMIFIFLNFEFYASFSLSSFTFIKRFFSSSLLSAIRVVSSAYLSLLISSSNLDSSLCFIQPSLDILLSQFGTRLVPCQVWTVASQPPYRFLRRQVSSSGIPISWRTFHSLLWSTQLKALAESMKQKQMFFWNCLAFSLMQRVLASWFLVPLPYLNTACTYGSSLFTYCWGLAWRILSITC